MYRNVREVIKKMTFSSATVNGCKSVNVHGKKGIKTDISIFEDGSFKVNKCIRDDKDIIPKINPVKGIFWKNNTEGDLEE